MQEAQKQKVNFASKAESESIECLKVPCCVSESLSKNSDVSKLNEGFKGLKSELSIQFKKSREQSAANKRIDPKEVTDKKAEKLDHEKLARILNDSERRNRMGEVLCKLSGQRDDLKEPIEERYFIKNKNSIEKLSNESTLNGKKNQ